MKRGVYKKGSVGEQRLKYGHSSPQRTQVSGCPYRGLRAAGWRAFHRGDPEPSKPSGYGKAYAYHQGWIKAKLAKEQGKKAL